MFSSHGPAVLASAFRRKSTLIPVVPSLRLCHQFRPFHMSAITGIAPRDAATVVAHDERAGRVPVHGQRLALSPCESAMAHVSLQLRGSMKVTVAMILRGTVDLAALTRAVSSLSALHPVLRSKLVPAAVAATEPDGELLLEVDNSLEVPIFTHSYSVQVVDAGESTATACQWLAHWHRHVAQVPLRLNAPLAQVDVISSDDDQSSEQNTTTTALLVTAEHAFCDGQSLSYLCHQLLQLYSGVSLVPTSTWGPSFEHACGSPQSIGPEKLALRMSGFPKFPMPSPAEVAPFPARRTDLNAYQLAHLTSTSTSALGTEEAASNTRIAHFSLTAEQSLALLQQCRAQATTITGALGAAMMKAAAEVILATTTASPYSQTRTVSLSCGADTRKLYQTPISASVLSYHVSGVPPFVRSICDLCTDNVDETTPSEKESLWTLARQFRGTIEEAVKVEYPLAIAGFMGKLWSAYLDQSAVAAPKPLTLSLTNWGQLAIQSRYDATAGNFKSLEVLDVFPAVNMGHMALPSVVATSAAGKLTLTVVTHKEIIEEEHAGMLRERVKRLVLSLL